MQSFLISMLLFAATALAAPLDAAEFMTNDKGRAAAECKPIIMIYARGTWEPGTPPNQVAAPLIKALSVPYPGKVEAQIVQYDGGASGYLTGGSADGTRTMEQMTKAAAQRCPDSKLLM